VKIQQQFEMSYREKAIRLFQAPRLKKIAGEQ
jgi:hypothetical protein